MPAFAYPDPVIAAYSTRTRLFVCLQTNRENSGALDGDHGNTAQFIWVDLREFLPKQSNTTVPPQPNAVDGDLALFFSGGPHGADTPEQRLAKRIFYDANVQLLPGQEMSCKWPGYFRLCFTAYEKNTVVDAVQGMCKKLTDKPKTRT